MRYGLKYRGVSTIEVMTMLIAISMVILASYGAKIATFQTYREIVHRERAQLYAAETLEQLEAIRLTRVQQNYVHSWENFLGALQDGSYQLLQSGDLNQLSLSKVAENRLFTDEDTASVRVYGNGGVGNERGVDGFFTRLERRISLVTIPAESGETPRKLVIVSVYWGPAGVYVPESAQQIFIQSLYSKQVQPGFAL